jgi:N-acyl-phosphatidylethanolamine-hydrolysing phospholipase D
LNVLADPIFSSRCSPTQIAGPKRFVDPPFKVEDLPDIDIAVISHNHYDHLDYNTVMSLKDRVKKWYVPLRVSKWFTDCGIENVQEMDWWESTQFTNTEKEKQAQVVFVPCQHFSGRSLTDRCQTLWGSWVVIGPNHRMYFAGDTGITSIPSGVTLAEEISSPEKFPMCPAFEQIGKKYGPFDLGCIPIGAYNPRELMSPVHLNPNDAVQVHKFVRSKQSIAMHWGTFTLTDEPILEPPQLLSEALSRNNLNPSEFITLKHGETRSFPEK